MEYEVVIINQGYSTWLASKALPRDYYSQKYLESKNILYVNEWNNIVTQPQFFDSDLYEIAIDYQVPIDYDYEVNYLIYNYMIYFQNTFKQTLFGTVPPQ